MSRKGPWMKGGGGFQKQKEKPLFTVKNSSTDGLNQQEADTSFSVDREAGSFAAGWKLYFPFKSKSFSNKSQIYLPQTFVSHFQRFQGLP